MNGNSTGTTSKLLPTINQEQLTNYQTEHKMWVNYDHPHTKQRGKYDTRDIQIDNFFHSVPHQDTKPQ